MFGFESNQKQINKLEKKIASLTKIIEGGLFEPLGLQYEVRNLNEANKIHTRELDATRKRLSILEEIVREAGLITDFDDDEVKIREDRKFDMYNGIHIKQVPYQINKVKTV